MNHLVSLFVDGRRNLHHPQGMTASTKSAHKRLIFLLAFPEVDWPLLRQPGCCCV